MEPRASRMLGKLYQLSYILVPPCTEYCLASQEGRLELTISVSEPSQTPCEMLNGQGVVWDQDQGSVQAVLKAQLETLGTQGSVGSLCCA